MSNISEDKLAIPREIYKPAVDQALQFLNSLKTVINDKTKSHKICRLLINKRLYKTPFKIEIYDNIFIPVYIYIYDEKDRYTPRGSFGDRDLRICIGISYNPTNETLVWKDSYKSVLIHELTHLFQTRDVALRYLSIKDIPVSSRNLLNVMLLVMTGRDLDTRKDTGDNIDRVIKDKIAHYKKPAELGADANVLIEYLLRRYGENAVIQIVNCVERGRPSVSDIDNAIRAADRHGNTVWGSYDEIINLERRYKNIREEMTQGYQLKITLLKIIAEFYKRHYK